MSGFELYREVTRCPSARYRPASGTYPAARSPIHVTEFARRTLVAEFPLLEATWLEDKSLAHGFYFFPIVTPIEKRRVGGRHFR